MLPLSTCRLWGQQEYEFACKIVEKISVEIDFWWEINFQVRLQHRPDINQAERSLPLWHAYVHDNYLIYFNEEVCHAQVPCIFWNIVTCIHRTAGDESSNCWAAWFVCISKRPMWQWEVNYIIYIIHVWNAARHQKLEVYSGFDKCSQ